MSISPQSIRPNQFALLLVILLTIYLFIMFKYNLWHYQGIPHVEPIFLDLHAILAASDCHQKGYDVFRENPCDVMSRPHVYSRLWLAIGKTGLNMTHKNLLGSLIITTFLLLAVKIMNPQNMKELLASSILLFSPAVMLGVERANPDLIIFILLVIAVYLLFSKMRFSSKLTYFIFYLATFLKFYPVISFAVFVRHIKDHNRFWLLVMFSVLVGGIFVWISYPDLLQLRKTIPRPTGKYSFGGVLFFLLLGVTGNLSRILTLCTACVALFLALELSSKTYISGTEASPINTTFFILGSSILLFCFLAGTNYDYRTIYFILIFPYLFELLKDQNLPVLTKRLIYLFLALLTLVLWSTLILRILSLASTELKTSVEMIEHLTHILLILEHFCSWIVMTILLVLYVVLFKQPAQEKILGLFTAKI